MHEENTHIFTDPLDMFETRSAEKPLEIPLNVLKALIPDRLMELVADPQKVDVLITTRDDYSGRTLEFCIVERDTAKPLTSEADWHSYHQQVEQEKAGQDIYIFPPLPPTIDKMHSRLKRLVDSGEIRFNDRILLEVRLRHDPLKPDQLYISGYQDREELRGKGVATAFYTNLADKAKKLGYRFIVGNNNGKNISFFLSKLNRVPLNQIKPEYRTLFMGDNLNDPFTTVQFLYPEDRDQYCLPTAA